jgi:hypothetical protein
MTLVAPTLPAATLAAIVRLRSRLVIGSAQEFAAAIVARNRRSAPTWDRIPSLFFRRHQLKLRIVVSLALSHLNAERFDSQKADTSGWRDVLHLTDLPSAPSQRNFLLLAETRTLPPDHLAPDGGRPRAENTSAGIPILQQLRVRRWFSPLLVLRGQTWRKELRNRAVSSIGTVLAQSPQTRAIAQVRVPSGDRTPMIQSGRPGRPIGAGLLTRSGPGIGQRPGERVPPSGTARLGAFKFGAASAALGFAVARGRVSVRLGQQTTVALLSHRTAGFASARSHPAAGRSRTPGALLAGAAARRADALAPTGSPAVRRALAAPPVPSLARPQISDPRKLPVERWTQPAMSNRRPSHVLPMNGRPPADIRRLDLALGGLGLDVITTPANHTTYGGRVHRMTAPFGRAARVAPRRDIPAETAAAGRAVLLPGSRYAAVLHRPPLSATALRVLTPPDWDRTVRPATTPSTDFQVGTSPLALGPWSQHRLPVERWTEPAISNSRPLHLLPMNGRPPADIRPLDLALAGLEPDVMTTPANHTTYGGRVLRMTAPFGRAARVALRRDIPAETAAAGRAVLLPGSRYAALLHRPPLSATALRVLTPPDWDRTVRPATTPSTDFQVATSPLALAPSSQRRAPMGRRGDAIKRRVAVLGRRRPPLPGANSAAAVPVPPLPPLQVTAPRRRQETDPLAPSPTLVHAASAQSSPDQGAVVQQRLEAIATGPLREADRDMRRRVPPSPADVRAIADRVYDVLVDRLRQERRARGI